MAVTEKRKSEGEGTTKAPSDVKKVKKAFVKATKEDAKPTFDAKKRKAVSANSQPQQRDEIQPPAKRPKSVSEKSAKKQPAESNEEGSVVPREDAGSSSGDQPVQKKKKLGKKEREKAKKRAAAGGEPAAAPTGPSPQKKRYTLFVGNLPYDISKSELEEYFGKFTKNKVESVRMLTDKGTGEFKGTCFVDLIDAHSYEVCLRLHHTKLQDRKINVEPTVGGGGNSENRRRKLKMKTQKFTKQRRKRVATHEKVPKKKGHAGADQPAE